MDAEMIAKLLSSEEGKAVLEAALKAADPNTAKIEEAKAKRQEAIKGKAKEIYEALKTFVESVDMPAEVICQLGATSATSCANQYMWARRNSEWTYRSMERMKDQGTKTSMDDGFGGLGEINPMRDKEMAVQHFHDMMDWYEASMHAYAHLWNAGAAVMFKETGQLPKLEPRCDISEEAYQRFESNNQARYAQRQKQEAAASRDATNLMQQTSLPTWVAQVTEEKPAAE